MAYAHDSNIGSYPTIFGTTANTSRDDLIVYFDRSSGNVNNGLKMRPNFKLHNKTRHTMATDWTGPYLNAFYDDLERKKASIDNAVLPAWVNSNASGTLPSWPYTIGTGRNATQQTRMFVGKISSVRLYNRILTDDELRQNRKVDEIRYRGNFADYANLTVVNAQPDGLAEGETVQSSMADGDYELTGSMTFTAAPVVVDGLTLSPRYTIETMADGTWTQTARVFGEACTLAAGAAPKRLTWTWEQKPGLTIIVR